jgi:hypothetical protein
VRINIYFVSFGNTANPPGQLRAMTEGRNVQAEGAQETHYNKISKYHIRSFIGEWDIEVFE